MTDKGWKEAKDITVEDKIQTTANFVKVTAVETEELETPIKVYNLNVLCYHTYVIGEQGLIVHNNCKGFNSKTVDSTKKIKGTKYKNVRMDVEMNPVGKVDIHLQADGLPKMHYEGGTFPTAPKTLRESSFVENALKKAFNYIQRQGWHI